MAESSGGNPGPAMDLHETLDPKFEKLLRLGFADRKRLEIYKRVFQDTTRSMQNPEYRKYLLDVLEKLIKNTINDTTIYNRTQQNLMRQPVHEAVVCKNKKKRYLPVPSVPQTSSVSGAPFSADMTVKETKMSLIDKIKEIALQQILGEAAVRRTGRNLKNRSIGTVSSRRGVRRGTRKAKASNPDFVRKLVNKARQNIVKSQMNVAQQRQDQAAAQRDAQKYHYKLQNAQDRARVY